MRKAAFVIAVMMLTASISGDDTPRYDDSCHRPFIHPSQVEIENLYFSLAELSLHDQRQQMWSLSSTTKAALWTYNTERYIGNHPDLGIEARELLHRGVSLINTPAWFDIQDGSIGYGAKRAALAEFKRNFQEVLPADLIYEVLIRLGPEPSFAGSSARPTGERRDIQPDSWYNCYCGTQFDCGSSGSYDCFDGYCVPTPAHCGPYGDDPCWGKCKSTG